MSIADHDLDQLTWVPRFDDLLPGLEGKLSLEAIEWNEATIRAIAAAAEAVDDPIHGAVRKQPERALVIPWAKPRSLATEIFFLLAWGSSAALSLFAIAMAVPIWIDNGGMDGYSDFRVELLAFYPST